MPRRRPDLESCRHEYEGSGSWVVKDPLSLQYYRFQEEEQFLLESLDGRRNLDEVKRRFDARFQPKRISLDELAGFVWSLHRSGLVLADQPDQGEQLRQRGVERHWQEFSANATNFLSVRIPLLNPTPLLEALDGLAAWLFSPRIAGLIAALALAASLLVLVEFDQFLAKLPAFHDFFGPENWLPLAATVVFTKVAHEFGHALACRRYGGQCPEMGVMLLVFAPCLYCNVTDAWMFPSKWRRIVVGAAGMYVEVALASVAAFIWWFSAPGLVHYAALNVMFISSVTTLALNANPLMRYDGYYILADLVEIPNLREKAERTLQREAGRWLLGVQPPEDAFLPRQGAWFLALYCLAAFVYRWFITASIVWFLFHLFEPLGLAVLGQMLALVAAWSLLGQPLWQLVVAAWEFESWRRVSMLRAILSMAAVVALAAAVIAVPVPQRVAAPAVLHPRAASTVYVRVPGRVAEIHVEPGQAVDEGDPLVTLRSEQLRLHAAWLSGERLRLLAQLDDLHRRAVVDDGAALQVSQVAEAIRAIEDQIARQRADEERLVLRAPQAGVVMALPPRELTRDPGKLDSWEGSPLEPRNVGATLSVGTPVCAVGDPGKWRAEIAIPQNEVEFVACGQPVRLALAALPGEIRASQVVELARDVEIGRGRKQAAGDVARNFLASAPVDHLSLPTGGTGTAWIDVGRRPLGVRIWRFVQETFDWR